MVHTLGIISILATAAAYGEKDRIKTYGGRMLRSPGLGRDEMREEYPHDRQPLDDSRRLAIAPYDEELLPVTVVPIHYDLVLTPDIQKSRFDGIVNITVDVRVATNTISLHANELYFTDATFVGEDGETIQYIGANLLKKKMTATFTFEKELPTGKGFLRIAFEGVHNDDLVGFYRSTYTAKDGSRKTLVTTQFEPIDARRAFPCFDEPSLKATFDLTLIVDEKYMALSNMPEKSLTKVEDGKKSVQFMTSPIMSTYLLAFTVGDFEHIQAVAKDGTLVRCLSVPGKAKSLQFPLDRSVDALDYLNEYFGIPYPLPKIDHIAVPDHVSAMENWGLAIYGERRFLFNEATASSSQKIAVFSVIAHEVAHQWFGNLVTMQWWDDLWLNEGFATFMEKIVTDHFFPQWNVWESFVVGTERMMTEDGLRTSHPIIANTKGTGDEITYFKGARVIRLVHRVLGPEAFQAGLRNYMQKYKYNNTRTSQLWQEWTTASNLDVAELMGTWTKHQGYPLLTVAKDGNNAITVSQQWYLNDGSVQDGDERIKWVVPIALGNATHETLPLHYLREKSGSFTLPAGNWVKVNSGQHVPLRVKYSDELLKNLIDNMQEVPAPDRIGLIADCYALFKSKHVSGAQVVDLMSVFADEENTHVWDALATTIAGLDVFLRELSVYPLFKRFVRKLIATKSERLGWSNEAGDSDLIKMHRAKMINLQAKYNGDAVEVMTEANARFDAFLEDPATSKLPDDYKVPVFTIVLNGESERAKFAFNQLQAVAQNPDTEEQLRSYIYYAIGHVGVPELQQTALEWALAEDVRKQHMYIILLGVTGSSKAGIDRGFKFLLERWVDIRRKGGRDLGLVGVCLEILAAGNHDEVRKEADDFFENIRFKGFRDTIAKVQEQERLNAKFVEEIKTTDLVKDEFWAKHE